MTLTVPCLFGLESLVAEEMRRLELKNVRAENGRVHCDGTMADIARLNINLRCGARVLMELGSFPVRDFEALFQGVYALPWEDYIPRDGEFPVKGYSLSSQLHSVPACQAIVKKASAKRLGEKYGLETLPESGSRYQIQFAIIKDVATLYLDTSGEGLYKRGYRARNMGAPLRETLAAALVTLSRYRGQDPFCDPFCGSGTIPIEAALIAKNRAPGLDRSFAAQKWKNMDSKLWLEAGDEAMDKEFHGHYDIWAVTLTPPPWIWRGTTRSWPVWMTASALRWRTPENSTGTASTASWSPTLPTASVCWKRKRPKSCTGCSARRSGTCRPSGGCWCSAPIRSLNGALESRRAKSASSTTA